MIQVTLPLPPSTNNLYFNLKRGGRAKSVAYKDWLRIAKAECLAAYARAGHPEYGPKEKMRLTMRVGVNYRRDVTNCAKPVEDALVAFLPIPDDRYNDQIGLIRDLDCEGFVVCIIEPLAACAASQHGLEKERAGNAALTAPGPDHNAIWSSTDG